jgi:hypothetical protein
MCKTEVWIFASQAGSALSFFEQGIKLFFQKFRIATPQKFTQKPQMDNTNFTI